MAKYKINLLDSNPIFHEMLIQEFEDINKIISRKILKDIPILNSLEFYLDDVGSLGFIYRTKDSREEQVILENKETVSLSIEDMSVYFEFDNKEEILEEYPTGLEHDFLEVKEPNLFLQLKQLQLVRNPNLEEIVKEQIIL